MSFHPEVQDLISHINKLKENAAKKLLMSGVSPDRISYYYLTDSTESGVILDQDADVGEPMGGTVAYRVNVVTEWRPDQDYIATTIDAKWAWPWSLLG